MAVVFGIDVSHFQHGLSLAAVQRQGYGFVIAKATEGRGFQDPDFHTFREEAQSLGLPFAAYHFLHSDSPAGVQAENLAEQLNGQTNIPVMIDCEPTKGSNPTLGDVRRFIAGLLEAGPAGEHPLPAALPLAGAGPTRAAGAAAGDAGLVWPELPRRGEGSLPR
jgi:hypothetical protein